MIERSPKPIDCPVRDIAERPNHHGAAAGGYKGRPDDALFVLAGCSAAMDGVYCTSGLKGTIRLKRERRLAVCLSRRSRINSACGRLSGNVPAIAKNRVSIQRIPLPP